MWAHVKTCLVGHIECWQQLRTIALGPGLGRNRTVAKSGIRLNSIPELSIQVRFDGNLLTPLNWAGCQQVRL